MAFSVSGSYLSIKLPIKLAGGKNFAHVYSKSIQESLVNSDKSSQWEALLVSVVFSFS